MADLLSWGSIVARRDSEHWHKAKWVTATLACHRGRHRGRGRHSRHGTAEQGFSDWGAGTRPNHQPRGR